MLQEASLHSEFLSGSAFTDMELNELKTGANSENKIITAQDHLSNLNTLPLNTVQCINFDDAINDFTATVARKTVL